MSVNEALRDALIEQDVVNRRVMADVDSKVQARLAQLEQELKALMARHDPWSTENGALRRARQFRLTRLANKKIQRAYTDIAALQKKLSPRLVAAESALVQHALSDALP